MKLGGILNYKPKIPKLSLRKWLKGKNRKNALKALGIIAIIFLAVILWWSKDLPTPEKLAKLHASESTKILDRNGTVLYETGEQRRTVIAEDQISDHIKNATISAEDDNFYNHFGIDLKGIARAAISDIMSLNKGQGGSTITQQYVKNAVLSPEKSISRKIKEAILSLELEQIYSKDEILTMYLNEIPYGGNIYGVQEASRVYYGKEAKDLSLSEAATLAAIPKAPTYYSPYGTHTDQLFSRKNYILDRMLELGYASEEDVNQAKQDAPNSDDPNFKERIESIRAPHFVMYVREKLVDQYGERMVDSGGLKVTTTLDLEKQDFAEEAIANNDAKITRYGATNAALVSTDVKTGEIVAMVGGKDYFDTENQGNVNVIDSARQPGSSFKPIVYAAALKQPRFSPSFTFYDLKTDFSGYSPNNYDGSTHGPVTMRTALANSLNIPAVKALAMVGVPDALKTAKDLGITTLNQPERYGLSLVLGGGEVKPLEMAGAFSAFANQGTYHKPVAILKIEDAKGKTLYEYKQDENEYKAIDPQIAYEITDMLDDDNARCMSLGCQNPLNFGELKVAAKTGTTQEYRDAWTVGYSPKYSAAVWVGNNDNTKMRAGAAGLTVASPIFRDYMIKLADDTFFDKPDGIQEVTVEKYSNLLPSEHSQEFTKDIFASWQVPTERDDVNITLRVNKANNLIATESTPPELIEEKVFKSIHNEWGDNWNKYPNWEGPVRAWAEAAGYLLPPTHKDDSYSYLPKISITSPLNGSQVSGKVALKTSVDSEHPVSSVTYYLNDTEIGSSSSSPYSVSLDTESYDNGSYTLRAKMSDENSVTAENTINIKISNSLVPEISNVSIDNSAAGKAEITFLSSIASSSYIKYGKSSANLSQTKQCSSSTKDHLCNLIGLAPSTKYYFNIVTTSSGKNSNFKGSFTSL